jgi:hypothetical protein
LSLETQVSIGMAVGGIGNHRKACLEIVFDAAGHAHLCQRDFHAGIVSAAMRLRQHPSHTVRRPH